MNCKVKQGCLTSESCCILLWLAFTLFPVSVVTAADNRKIDESIVFFFYQIFKRDFPLAAAPYAPGCVYGSVANNSLAKGIVCMPDMFLILFVFGHGKSPLSE